MIALIPTVAALATLPLLALGQQSSKTYAPSIVECPADLNIVRHAGVVSVNQTLSPDEDAYIKARRAGVTKEAYATFLKSVQGTLKNETLPDYLVSHLSNTNNSELPRLGIAVSGGGYRATIFGAGILHALDGRNESSVAAGTGGLLQAADRLAGLSGGSWLVSSLATANFPTLPTLAFGPESATEGGWGGWNAQLDLLSPAGANNSIPQIGLENLAYYRQILMDLASKRMAGFDVTFGDFWARALSYHFLNGTTPENFFSNSSSHGAGILFSDIAETDSYKSFQQPFPIILTNSQSPGQNVSNDIGSNAIPISNTVYEMNPYEMGSWDPDLSAFTPVQYLGTTVNGGRPVNQSRCVEGFDQTSFLFGTSSNIFISYNITADSLAKSAIAPFIQQINSTFGALQPDQQLDISAYPNPFYGLGTSKYLDTDETELRLLDGGFDGEVTPYQPLLVPAREVDVIIGVDADANTPYAFVNGTSVINTQRRSNFYNGSYPFPKVPTDAATFVSQKLDIRPTFFGCNEAPGTPLLIFIPNSPPLDPSIKALTNTTTAQMQYQSSQIQGMFAQTFQTATRGYPQGNATSDPLWSVCLACAVVDRSRARSGVPRSGVCTGCFDRYCWNGNETMSNVTNADGGSKGSTKSAAFQTKTAAAGGLMGLFTTVVLSTLVAL